MVAYRRQSINLNFAGELLETYWVFFGRSSLPICGGGLPKAVHSTTVLYFISFCRPVSQAAAGVSACNGLLMPSWPLFIRSVYT